MTILIFFLSLFMATAIYFGLVRNTQVYDARVKLIYDDFKAYERLPPYHKMVYSFRRVSKFIEEAKKQTT